MTPPKPPLPRALQRRPARPGENGAGPNGNGEAPTAKDQVAEGAISTVGWLDERTGASPFLRGFLYRKVPKGTNWFYTLGSAHDVRVPVAGRDGRVPGDVLRARSCTRLRVGGRGSRTSSSSGELVRGMHRWGSTVMILLIFLHMGRTFFFGAYKYPRELNWIIGVILLVLTLLMGFTGYLLPFDQRSFWATVVGVNLNSSGPIVGPYLADFLRGGPEFGAYTLSRFYAMHMLLIPGLIAALIGAHLYLVAKLGTTAPPWLKAEKSKALAKEQV